jgi:probable addiction module antidote protein
MTTRFDISEHLHSPEMIAEYLNTVLEDGNTSDLTTAIGHIAKAYGMGKLAEQTGMSRTSLYKAFSDGAKPQFDTVMKVLKAIGGNLKVEAIHKPV